MYPVGRVLKEAALFHFSAIKLQETPEREPGTMFLFEVFFKTYFTKIKL